MAHYLFPVDCWSMEVKELTAGMECALTLTLCDHRLWGGRWL